MGNASRKAGVAGMLDAVQLAVSQPPSEGGVGDDLSGVPSSAVNGDLLRRRLVSAEAESENLRVQLEQAAGAPKEVMLDAKKVRLSALVDRVSVAFEDAKFKALIEDMREVGGNVVHAVVRRVDPTGGETGHTHEVLYGQRRWAASVALGTPLRAFEIEADDRRAVELMRAENSHRAKLSDYEVAMRARRYTAMGIYPSLTEAFRCERVSRSAMSKLEAIAELPDALFALMKDPRQMTQRWAQEIRAAAKHAESEATFYAPVLTPSSGKAFQSASLSLQDVRELLGLVITAPAVVGRTVFGPAGNRNLELAARDEGRTNVIVRAELTDEQLDAIGLYVASMLSGDPAAEPGGVPDGA